MVPNSDADDRTTSGSTRLHPPRWAPAPMRWHATPVSWWQSWKFGLSLIPRIRDRTHPDWLNGLPGLDDVMVTRLPFAKLVVVRSPELARHVLVTNQINYRKSPEYDILGVAFGRGLITNIDEQRWQRNRRLVQPVFAKRNVDRFAAPMVAAATDAVARLRELSEGGTPVDMSAEMNRLALDIASRTMFGLAITGPMSEVVFERLLRLSGIGFISGVNRPLHMLAARLHRRGRGDHAPDNSRLPIRVLRLAGWVLAPRAMRDLRHAERVIAELIADHRSGRTTGKDNLLALLMDARDPESGDAYTDQEIRDELMTFIGAGTETSATALTWVWRLLAEHPDVAQQLRDELRTVLDGRPATADDVPNLPWTQAIVAETMRLLPPVVVVSRTAKNADVLGDFVIKPKTNVAVVIPAVHHHPRVWDQPDTFDPTRYLPGGTITREHKTASIPFGAGKRMCVASGLATMEAALAVATIAQHLEFELATDQPIRRVFSFTGGPDGSLLMRVRAPIAAG
jgi:cytochrome P450